MEKDEYLEAWTEGDEEKKAADPIVDSVKAARKADADAYADAFKNDRFGIDVEAAAKKDDDQEKPIEEAPV